MGGDPAGSGQAHEGTLGEAAEVAGTQRRVGRDDEDAGTVGFL
jgi:hypothetical protein